MSNPITSIYNATRNTLSRIKPPFFDGLSVWDVLYFFFKESMKVPYQRALAQ